MRLQIRESQKHRLKFRQQRNNNMTNHKPKTGRVEEKVVNAYKKIENGVVSGYQTIEDAVVGTYQKIEDKFVEKFLEDGPKEEK